MKRILPQQVADLIDDQSTVALTGFGGMGQCDAILKALRKSYMERGHPRDLTIYHAAGQSDGKNGLEHIAYEGLITRIYGGHWGLLPKTRSLIENNQVAAYCLPQGQLIHLFRTMANGLPGHLSPIGLGTFVDPRMEGGRFNEKAKREDQRPVELIEMEGKEYLYYKSVPLDFVLIRATSVDEAGNVSTEEEPLKMELLTSALAAKAHGGKVIVQTKYMVRDGSIHPKQVDIPGYLVDYVVQAPDAAVDHRQVPSSVYDPKYSGDLRVPVKEIPALPLTVRKVIGRRAIKELNKGSVVNIGIGIPGDVIGPVGSEEGLLEQMMLTVESGVVGGLPVGENEFGITLNADAIIGHASQFDFYHGTGVDLTFMGAAEIDEIGQVNVSKFGGRLVGSGGFIDVTQPAKKVVFCTPFTNGGLEVVIRDGRIQIAREGRIKKFVKQVEQVTFSGKTASAKQQPVIYVTERAVFQLSDQGLVLTEIAPGIDLEKDVLAQMEFHPMISSSLTTMDESLFMEVSVS